MNRLAEETTSTPVEATADAAPQSAPVEAAPAAPAPRADRHPSDLNAELQTSENDGPLKEVANGRAYEITYIVRANDPEAVTNSQAGLKALVESVDGAVDNVRVSDTRRLAYPINKQADGVYVVVNARFEKSLVTELDRFFKLDEAVLRHIVLRQDA